MNHVKKVNIYLKMEHVSVLKKDLVRLILLRETPRALNTPPDSARARLNSTQVTIILPFMCQERSSFLFVYFGILLKILKKKLGCSKLISNYDRKGILFTFLWVSSLENIAQLLYCQKKIKKMKSIMVFSHLHDNVNTMVYE